MDKTTFKVKVLRGTYSYCWENSALLHKYGILFSNSNQPGAHNRLRNIQIENRQSQILSIHLNSRLNTTPAKESLANNNYENVKELNYKLLSISFFFRDYSD